MAKLNVEGTALLYSTYLGGSGYDVPNGIALDSAGNAYVAGSTGSPDFPIVSPFQAEAPGGSGSDSSYDGFLAKLSPAGEVLYSTYLGGSQDDSLNSIAVDGTGSAYVAGQTVSIDFPTASPFQVSRSDEKFYTQGDAFVTKLTDSDGPTLFVPVVLSAFGMNGSFYTSEMALTNRGSKDANLEFNYVSSFGRAAAPELMFCQLATSEFFRMQSPI